jgi:hypothetical protein
LRFPSPVVLKISETLHPYMTDRFELSLRHKRQATLLYHYTSIEYLRGLKGRVDAVIKGIDITLQQASEEGRDRYLVSERWGGRDTSANWSTYGFPALLDLQKSVARQISNVAVEVYYSTGVYNCIRTLNELSMGWATLEEEDHFEKQMDALYKYAMPIDDTLGRPPSWEDSILYGAWGRAEREYPRIPKFRLRIDVMAETGKKTPRTGVYAPLDDPYGTLQFAWTGNDYGNLCDCSTFNQMGLDAVAAVGLENLWNDSPRLLSFFMRSRYRKDYEKDCRRCNFDPINPSSATAFLSGSAFVDRPCKWVFVEMLPGEYEDLSQEDAVNEQAAGRLRALPTELVPKTGLWWSPAIDNGKPRPFSQGDRFPDTATTDYGAVVWYFDPDKQQGA